MVNTSRQTGINREEKSRTARCGEPVVVWCTSGGLPVVGSNVTSSEFFPPDYRVLLYLVDLICDFKYSDRTNS